MRNLILFIVFVLSGSSYSQGGWKRKYLFQNSQTNITGHVFETPSGNYIMTGLTYEKINNDLAFRLSIVVTDPQGNILHHKRYGNSKFNYLDGFGTRVIVNDDTHFYITDCVRDSNNKQITVLIKCDFNGDTIWQKIYRENLPNDLVPIGLAKSIDNGFLITGFSQEPNKQACILLKTDRNGNELWRKKIYKSAPAVHSGNAVIQDTASKKIIIVGYQYLNVASHVDIYSSILILDSLGNNPFQTTFNNDGGGPFNEIIQLKDKNFLTCGSVNTYSYLGFTERLNSVVVKFDINGNIIWKKTYDTLGVYNRIDQLHERANGDIIMSGILDTMANYNQPEIAKVKMFRIDKNGNVKWRKYIGNFYDNPSSESLRTMRPTQDGGYIFAIGSPFMNDPKPYYIIKTDSMGCDTLEAWCQSVILGLGHNTLTGYQFDVFPNPAQDVVLLKADVPAHLNVNVNISDVSGKAVKTQLIPAGKEYRLDVSDLSGGVYFMTLMQDTKVLEKKKLVIMK